MVKNGDTDLNMDTVFIPLNAQPRASAPFPPLKNDLTDLKTWKLTSKYYWETSAEFTLSEKFKFCFGTFIAFRYYLLSCSKINLKLAENGEYLISDQPWISAHLEKSALS